MSNLRRTIYIVRNSGRCKFCGTELTSNYKKDKKYHSCRPFIWFEISGGDISLRRRFYPDKAQSGFVDTSFVRPFYLDNLSHKDTRDWAF